MSILRWTSFRYLIVGAALMIVLLPSAESANPQQGTPIDSPVIQKEDYFRITVIDEETGRGVPLVELTTMAGVQYITDSAGVVAYYEPGLMNRNVYFEVRSHGYEYKNERDFFGYRGIALQTVPGGSATLSIKRVNIAQRIYRITGSGIYHQSYLLGDEIPIEYPLLNASVMGQDSTLVTVYQGKVFWIWGDTSHPRHPLAGSFKATGATSLLPEQGGLDPDLGINLRYFQKDGVARQMIPLPGNGPYWMSGLLTVPDSEGRERLLGNYAEIQAPMTRVAFGLLQFNDETEVFEPLLVDSPEAVLLPEGHAFPVNLDGEDYYYFSNYGLSLVRARMDYDSLLDRSTLETYTCLKQGSRFDKSREQLDRADDGSLRYSWKRNTSPMGQSELNEMVKKGFLSPDERRIISQDIAGSTEIRIQANSITWNPYRKRWILITSELFGHSVLGEVWYLEADAPEGPWVYARKIVSHDQYSFYNPVQHPHFSKENGRIIYFEGTYTHTFSGAETRTPRYNYNQIMYKLELDDSRLALPVAVYRTQGRYRVHQDVPDGAERTEIAFYAPDRPMEGTIPIYEIQDVQSGAFRLSAQPDPSDTGQSVFYAPPADRENLLSNQSPLYEYRHQDSGQSIYTTNDQLKEPGYQKSAVPLCIVWNNPTRFNPFRK